MKLQDKILICGDDVNHIRNVLRMREGEELWISAGGEKGYYCSIQSLSPEQIELKIYYISRPDYELPTRLYRVQGIPKGDKMDLIVQKAVELGAYSIIPVEMKRCVVRLDAKKAQKKQQRWQQIAEGRGQAVEKDDRSKGRAGNVLQRSFGFCRADGSLSYSAMRMLREWKKHDRFCLK